MHRSRQFKIKVAWGVAGLLVFAVLFGSTTSERYRSSSLEGEESKRIGFLFENIRQANLQKDIDLFMSCFSSDFSDKEGKRQDTLKMWETFNYQDLSYDLKELTLLGDTAVVKLEWVVLASEKLGGKPHNGTTLLDVSLRREDGSWKITRIKPAS
jgi:ketosteroid isomerase-like protein